MATNNIPAAAEQTSREPRGYRGSRAGGTRREGCVPMLQVYRRNSKYFVPYTCSYNLTIVEEFLEKHRNPFRIFFILTKHNLN